MRLRSLLPTTLALAACSGPHALTGPGEGPTPMHFSEGREEAAPPPADEAEASPAESLPESLEPVAVPARAASHYGLVVRTEPGIAGRVLLNDVELGDFGFDGYSMASNHAQCALRAGDNHLVVEVSERDGNAAAPQGGALVAVDLHGATTEVFPSADNRLFHVQWDPTSPARRVFSFALGQTQAPARTADCDAVAGGTLTLDETGR